MAGLVETMRESHTQLPKAKTPPEQESVRRAIEATDKQTDALVYELYGLTAEETETVEVVADGQQTLATPRRAL